MNGVYVFICCTYIKKNGGRKLNQGKDTANQNTQGQWKAPASRDPHYYYLLYTIRISDLHEVSRRCYWCCS